MADRTITIFLRGDGSQLAGTMAGASKNVRSTVNEMTSAGKEAVRDADKYARQLETKAAQPGQREMARFISKYNANEARSVAYVQTQVSGALAQMEKEAAGGGVLSPKLTDAQRTAAAQRRQIDDRYFQATHEQREVDLRNLRRYYAQQRLEHQGNTQALAKLDRSYHAQKEQIDIQYGQGGKGVRGMLGRHGLIGGNVRHGLSAAGMSGIGGEAGFMLSMIAEGGIAAAAITAPLLAAGIAYSSYRKGLLLTLDAQRDFNKEQRASAAAYREITATTTTEYGGKIRPMLAGHAEALAAVNEESRTFDSRASLWEKATSPWERSAQRRAIAARKSAAEMSVTAETRIDEREGRIGFAQQGHAMERQAGAARASADAGAYDRPALEIDAKQKEAEAQAQERRNERLRALKDQRMMLGESEFQKRRDSVNAEGDRQAKQPKLLADAQREILKQQRAVELAKMGGQANESSIAVAGGGLNEPLNQLKEKHRLAAEVAKINKDPQAIQDLRKQTEANEVTLAQRQKDIAVSRESSGVRASAIAASTVGYQRERELLKERQRAEMEEAVLQKKSHEEGRRIKVRQANETKSFENDHALATQEARRADESAATVADAGGTVSAHRARELIDLEHELKDVRKEGQPVVDQAIAAKKKLYASEDARDLVNTTKDLSYQLALLKGTMTQTDAAAAKYLDTTGKKMPAAIRKGMLDVAAAGWNQNPYLELKKHKAEWDEEVKAGSMSKEKEKLLLSNELRKMGPPGGQMMGTVDYVHSTTSRMLEKGGNPFAMDAEERKDAAKTMKAVHDKIAVLSDWVSSGCPVRLRD